MNLKLFCIIIFYTLACQGVLLEGQEKAKNPVPVEDAHHSWKLAQNQATSADMITVPEGFTVDLVRSANEEEGSWVALEFDDKNHLFVAKEDKGILRFSLDSNGELVNSKLVEDYLAQCRGLLWAHDSLYVNSNNPNPPPMKVLENSDGLFRLKDTTGDGAFDSRKQLLQTSQGSPGHGRNQMKLGPDGLIYFMSGYDVFLTEKVNPKSFLKNFDEDQLIPNPWDNDWFNKHGMAPGGHLMRMDEDGQFFQLIAGGFRNPMDIAFNRDGEIFTFDADMEWDAALAWYKPTRVLHVVSGADYGWRRATGKLPAYYEDSLPSVVDVGLGSPTGIDFGYKSKYPGKWKNALFAGDWTYGRILAVHMTEEGSSFTGEFETFAAGRPMNVVDLTFGPDGHMYFVTGGMKTKSGIYRVRWTGDDVEDDATMTTQERTQESLLRNLRYQLEFFQVIQSKKGAQLAMHHIHHPDDFIRHAARIALENQDPQLWTDQALASSSPAGFIALARAGGLARGRLVKRMNQIDLDELGQKELLGMLRAYQVEFARNGKPAGRLLSDAVNNISKLFPHSDSFVNYELAEILVYLEDPKALSELCALIEKSDTTEDLSQYLVYSRYIKSGWGLETKRTFLKGVQRLESFPGGKFHQKIVNFLREEMIAKLSDPEKLALKKWSEPAISEESDPVVSEPVAFVKAWTVDDFNNHFGGPLSGRDYEKGRIAYKKANCVLCHKMNGNTASIKGVAGPDLSNVGGRFGPRDLLVSIVHPSRAINDKYRNPAAPNLSGMPPGQINVLTESEVIDLVAYLQSGGRENDPVYSRTARKVEKKESKNIPVMAVAQDVITPQDNSLISVKIASHNFDKLSAANNPDRERFYNDLKNILDTYPGASLELVGHADDTKYSQTNYDISYNRAQFTAQNMIYRGIPKSAISYRAVGDKKRKPSDGSVSLEGNRKVEVIVKLPKDN